MTARISAFALVLALSTTVFARDEYTRRFDKTVSVRSGARVMVENKFGDIVVHAHPGSDVAIHADIRVSASNEDQAKQYADKVEILVDSSSELSIRTRYPSTERGMMGIHWSNVSFSVHYDVTVPESSPLSVRNSFGAVSVTGTRTSSEISTSHGELIFHDGRGAQRLENSFARVEVANNAGDVNIETSNGAVEATDVKGALSVRDRFGRLTVARVSSGVNLVNTNGAVEVTDSGGVGDIRNSFGDVIVRNFHGDLTVNNSNGRVEATTVNGSANLRTTFGEVRFADVNRQLSIRSNNSKVSGTKVGGSLTLINSFGATEVSDVQHDLQIESGNGSVVVERVGGAATIKTSFGMVRATDVGGLLTVQNSNGSVTGANNKGAHINTSFGSVSVSGVSGPIQVENQNGSVDADSNLRGSCQPIAIRTSFSTLRVHLEPDASYRVAARTSFGKIRSDFPLSISGSISNDDINGTLGGGRCEMRLTNNNGAIEILKDGQ